MVHPARVALRFISLAIRIFHGADLGERPVSRRDLRARRKRASSAISPLASRRPLFAEQVLPVIPAVEHMI